MSLNYCEHTIDNLCKWLNKNVGYTIKYQLKSNAFTVSKESRLYVVKYIKNDNGDLIELWDNTINNPFLIIYGKELKIRYYKFMNFYSIDSVDSELELTTGL